MTTCSDSNATADKVTNSDSACDIEFCAPQNEYKPCYNDRP